MSEMTATRMRRLGTLAALGGVAVATAAALWRTRVPAELELASLDVRDYFSDEQLAHSDEFRGPQRALFLAGLAAQAAVLAGAVVTAPRVARAARRVLPGEVQAGIAVALVVAAVAWIVQLPLGAAGHRRRRRFGLSEQGWGGWLRDELVAVAVTGVLVVIAVAGAMLLARRFGPRWWLAGGPALVA